MFRIDRRLLLHFDWLLVGLAALLVGAGLLTLGSLVPRLLMRQLAWLGLGAVVVLVLISIDYRMLARWAYLGYIAGLMVLAAVLVLGRTAQGARRWLTVGPFTVQPSELFKLVLILTVAAYLARREDHRPGWDRIAIPLLLVAPAFALIVKQPDLGTALVLIPVVMALLFVGGARWRDLAILMGGGLAVAPAFWFFLRDYQRERLLVYLDPFRDPLGSAWNVIQAKITIGSGQLVGKGLFGGTQSRLAFLPERHTDFIFAAFAESWGFLGAVALLAAYGLLALRGLEVAATAR
ncbi:MAG TPA: FtsW/RodA/SpoVE family cell cycle protein, partial [Methylomirabilota bacterium]|nr:FtsW/RodA/SpoVE family cell cycle protein [Methylomirabilota bacterium]